MSRESWVRAAKEAFAGDERALRNRVGLAEADPVTIVKSASVGKTELVMACLQCLGTGHQIDGLSEGSTCTACSGSWRQP